jgi:hypothetical protein
MEGMFVGILQGEVVMDPEAIVFDLTTDPATSTRARHQALPTGAGAYTLMINLTDGVVLDADLEPLGPPIPTDIDTRWFSLSRDGRFFAVYLVTGAVNLYRSSGELVAELRVPGRPLSNRELIFSFSGDGSPLAGHPNPGNRRWALWDTETGDVANGGRSGGRSRLRHATGTQLGNEITGASSCDLQFATDGTTLMVIGGDHISVWTYDTTISRDRLPAGRAERHSHGVGGVRSTDDRVPGDVPAVPDRPLIPPSRRS